MIQNRMLTLKKKIALTRYRGCSLPHSQMLLQYLRVSLSSCCVLVGLQWNRNTYWKRIAGMETRTANTAFRMFLEPLNRWDSTIFPAVETGGQLKKDGSVTITTIPYPFQLFLGCSLQTQIYLWQPSVWEPNWGIGRWLGLCTKAKQREDEQTIYILSKSFI